MLASAACISVTLIILGELTPLVSSQWDPNHPLFGDPQWVKPRRKRTPGADQKWPPWDAPECPPSLSGPCQLPPYYPYDPISRMIPSVGMVVGRSMAYKPYRYINLFLGVPYAKPPVYERRFKVSIIALTADFRLFTGQLCLISADLSCVAEDSADQISGLLVCSGAPQYQTICSSIQYVSYVFFRR